MRASIPRCGRKHRPSRPHLCFAQPGAAPRAGGGGPKQPNLDHPRIPDQCTPAQWEDFIKEWGAYSTASFITPDVAPVHFFTCLDPEVKTLYRQYPGPNKLPIGDLVKAARALTVLRILTGQRRYEVLSMQ